MNRPWPLSAAFAHLSEFLTFHRVSSRTAILTRILLAVLSGFLLCVALPPLDIGWLGWVALIPLLVACQEQRPLSGAGLGLTAISPVHFFSASGEDMLISSGTYEPVLDLQFSLAKEGRDTLFLPALQAAHSEGMHETVAMLVPGRSDTRHLIFLAPDGKRFEVIGSATGVKLRSPEWAVALPNSRIKEAIAAAQPASASPSPCYESKLPTSPRWLPPGCSMPGGFPGGIPSPPVPYVDGSNMLHACVNNRTGAFRIVRSSNNCPYDEAKIKWQVVP